MEPVGRVTMVEVGDDRVYTDESGQSYTIPGRGTGMPLEIDPRIDLTRPIYEQVMRLMAKDRAAETRAKRRHAAKTA